MSTANPNDESTTASGDGWSEDMELAPVHPGDRAPETDGDREGERLQKVLARAGVGSRRVSEDMIEAGRISVKPSRTVRITWSTRGSSRTAVLNSCNACTISRALSSCESSPSCSVLSTAITPCGDNLGRTD